MISKGIITIAIGKKYIKQSKYLARSCILNANNTKRAVVTDSPDSLKSFYDIVIPWDNKVDPFSLKTRIYEFSPFEYSLFIDADSLVYDSIDEYWSYLNENSYVYEGKLLKEGNWYFNIKEICRIINVEWIPKFNSGMILFKKCDEAKQIFDTAYYYFLNHKKEEIDIPFFRGTNYPDEPFFAIALSKNKKEPINDYGKFSRTLIKARNIHLNIMKRKTGFIKNETLIHPIIVHFCGRRGGFYYFFEKLRLLTSIKK